MRTSIETWDSVEVENCETIFYCSQKDNPNAKSTDKIKYFDVDNTIFDMGLKNLKMFEWALENKEFDYVLRINASCYVNKKKLIEYVQGLPTDNLFMGVETTNVHGEKYLWGGTQYIISKDVIQKIIDNKEKMRHERMEDESMSLLVTDFGIPFTNGIKSCSIDRMGNGWQLTSYCGESRVFTGFDEIKDSSHVCYRVKQDKNRHDDEKIMHELFRVLN